MNRSRRNFIKTSATASAIFLTGGNLWAAGLFPVEDPDALSARAKSRKLKGFIFSDAHIGWESEKQPALEKQVEMNARLRERFPDLDLLIDTGDAWHNGRDRDKERGQWTDTFLSQDIPLPFYYVPGNHEITHANDADVEMICNTVGSMECRPYYSWDIKGIHFVSVPEMIRAVYIPKELKEWLRLDLELNRDKTTILLSHNNLIGTTTAYEEGYRGLVDTNEILEIINAYPNVIAWMNGHNHDYEIVEKFGKVFVSNGRIGGFDPSRGKHGLGGIYFEIDESGLSVRGYSVEYGRFVDQIDPTVARSTISCKTSFELNAPAGYSFGCGGSRDGERIPLFSHYAGGKSELFLAGAPGAVINDDPEFRYYMFRHSGDRQLMGCSINDKAGYDWLDPGIRIKKTIKRHAQMALPRSNHFKYTYYRVAGNKKYRVSVLADGGQGGGSFDIRFLVSDRQGGELFTVNKTFAIRKGTDTYDFVLDLPELKDKRSIYTDPGSDDIQNLGVILTFPQLEDDFTIRRIALSFDQAKEQTENAAIILDGKKYSTKGILETGRYKNLPMDTSLSDRTVAEISAGGNHRVSWLVRRSGCRWQVLGARVADKGDSLAIGPMRSLYSPKKEVVINPYVDITDPFVHRLRGIDRAEIFPFEKKSRKMSILVGETILDAPQVEVWSSEPPRSVKGCKKWTFKDHCILFSVKKGDRIDIAF